MEKLLQINTSLFSDEGQSTHLADRFVATWCARNPKAVSTVRDLVDDPVPHLDAERAQAFLTNTADRTPRQKAMVDFSEALIDEFRRADVVVLRLPTRNFGVPSRLKAYFDHIARAVTPSRAEQALKEVMTAKKVYVFATRGEHSNGVAQDDQEGYVRRVLGFLGLTNPEFVYAENMDIDET